MVVGAIAAPVVVMAWAVRRAAADFGRASNATDASAAAIGLADAVSGAMHSTAAFVVGELALVPLGMAIMLLTVAHGRSRLTLLAVVAAAACLEVLLLGGLGYVNGVIEAFQGLVTADPARKNELWLVAMTAVQGRFDTWVWGGAALGGLGGLLAMIAAGRRYAADLPGRGTAPPTGAAGGPAVGSDPSPSVLALLAVLGIAASVPALREAEVVLPPSPGLSLPHAPETLTLEGPDRVRQAPVLTLEHTGRLTLEGFAMESVPLLGIRLEELRQAEEMKHPDARHSTSLTLTIDRRTRGVQLRELLVALSAEGYTELQLVFASKEQLVRPLLGSTPVRHFTAVDVSLDTDAPGPVVSFTEAQTFAELAPELLKRRAPGVTPVLELATPSR